MFAIFTRLTRDDGVPRTESLRPDCGLTAKLRAMAAVSFVVGLVAFVAFVAVSGSTGQACRLGAGLHSASTRPAMSCQSVQEPQDRP